MEASAQHLRQAAFAGLGQPVTNCKPTAVSNVALASCKETIQVWSPTIPSLRDAAPDLKGQNGGFRMRPEIAADPCGVVFHCPGGHAPTPSADSARAG
jgi:hypothetical protein